MKLNEFLSNKRGFAESLQTPETIIGDMDIELSLKVKFGQSEVHKVFEDMTGSEVAEYLNSQFSNKWEWLTDFITQDFEVGETNRKTITENYTNDVEGNQSGENINSESAYNIDSFVNSDKIDSKLDNKSKQTGNRERIESYKSYYTSLQQLGNLSRNDIRQLVLQDIKNELCLKIY